MERQHIILVQEETIPEHALLGNGWMTTFDDVRNWVDMMREQGDELEEERKVKEDIEVDNGNDGKNEDKDNKKVGETRRKHQETALSEFLKDVAKAVRGEEEEV